MNKLSIILLCLILALQGNTQQFDSIEFHLYTDSLKKGTHNYISVDGKTKDGSWLPLTAKEVTFLASACVFEGNDLVIPALFNEPFVMVKAVLRGDSSRVIERKIWIKQQPEPPLPVGEPVTSPSSRRRRN